MNALEASGVVKRYERDGKSLSIVEIAEFAVREGEFVTVIGPSGCGKSTFLHIVGGFIPPESGSIRVYGKEVSGPGPDRGMMFQEFSLFPWRSVAGNIAWGLEAQGFDKDRINEIVDRQLAMIGLTDFRNHYPAELSGGMKQRVALARVLAFDPKVLLMDEPFGALDAQTREALQEDFILISKKLQTTVVFVTHSIDEALVLSDRIIVLSSRPGRIKKTIVPPFAKSRAATDLRSLPEFAVCAQEVRNLLREERAP
ncbi:MAG TPA: ABC transporter ATP-binding protein [Burkholderiales bacterium]|nr:ABC transporter ATP-binding protein [Burkholderiales bacterium]